MSVNDGDVEVRVSVFGPAENNTQTEQHAATIQTCNIPYACYKTQVFNKFHSPKKKKKKNLDQGLHLSLFKQCMQCTKVAQVATLALSLHDCCARF